MHDSCSVLLQGCLGCGVPTVSEKRELLVKHLITGALSGEECNSIHLRHSINIPMMVVMGFLKPIQRFGEALIRTRWFRQCDT